MIENKNYFMEKWKEALKSENVLVRYNAKQFIKINETMKNEALRTKSIETSKSYASFSSNASLVNEDKEYK